MKSMKMKYRWPQNHKHKVTNQNYIIIFYGTYFKYNN